MKNAGLDEAQAGIKIAGRNISNLRYVYDTTLMVESKEELKSLLMNMKEESEKIGLNLNNQKNKLSHCLHCFPIYLPWSDGTRCHDLSFLNSEF